jgi:hypothetical protein
MILLQLDNKKIIMLNTIFVFVVKYNIQLWQKGDK